MAHLAALGGIDEIALLLLDFGRGRDQQEQPIYSVESGHESLWFREIAFD